MNPWQFTFRTHSHVALGLHLTPHFSSCVFVSAEVHFVVSEQWSIAVSNDFLWNLTAPSTPGSCMGCRRSPCLPSTFLSACMQRKKMFLRRQKSDRQGCQSHSCLSTASAELQRAEERFLWRQGVLGIFRFHWTAVSSRSSWSESFASSWHQPSCTATAMTSASTNVTMAFSVGV